MLAQMSGLFPGSRLMVGPQDHYLFLLLERLYGLPGSPSGSLNSRSAANDMTGSVFKYRVILISSIDSCPIRVC